MKLTKNHNTKLLLLLLLSGSTLISCNSGSTGTAGVTYAPFGCNGNNNVSFPGVSGVREVESNSSQVYVTGVYVENGGNHSFLYQGPVTGGGVCNKFNYPSTPGNTVTSTSLYGPDNGGYGNVVVVGSYTNLESGPIAQQGLLYIGAADGSTISGYKTLYPASLVGSGDSIINTLGHSTMGGIAVGNYDTRLLTGQTFIYNINTDTYYPLYKPGAEGVSITAYGIWYNGGTSYTITGGYSDVLSGGINIGFITDWDSTTQQVSNFTTLNYNNLPGSEVAVHFEGITSDDKGGYNLAGDWNYPNQQTTPTLAHITRNADGSFAAPTWSPYSYYPGASWTSANTIYKNYILGLYQAGTPTTNYGYVATIPVNN